jgi:hypothetical protein
MRISDSSRCAFGIWAAAAVLSGCGGSQPSMGASTEIRHPERNGSWMSPTAAQAKVLLYASDRDKAVVHVYNYKTGAAVGRLEGFQAPLGQCVDRKGDVFIADYAQQLVYEYAHGGKAPITELQAEGSPIGCSVAPNGDLAVTNYSTASGHADIVIFQHASGTPTSYSNTACYYLSLPGYDGDGNLYVQASTYGSQQDICELPRGSATMKTVNSNVITSLNGVMWDGKYVTLAVFATSSGNTHIYQMKESASGDLTKVSETSLSLSNCRYTSLAQPFIVGNTNTPSNKHQGTAIVGSLQACIGPVEVWAYPEGGNPTRTFKSPSNYAADGLAVSIAE